MGAYTCQFGTVHKRCRCPTPHTIACPTPVQCDKPADPPYEPKHRKDTTT